MAVRTVGIWIIGLSFVVAAFPAALLGTTRGAAGLQLVGPALVALILAAVAGALAVLPTCSSVLWNGRQADGTEDRLGRFETRLYSIGAVVVAGLLLLIGAVSMLFIVPSAISGL